MGNNTKIDVQEVGCGITEWIDLAQDRDRWRASWKRGADGKIILKLTFKNLKAVELTGLMWLGIGTGGAQSRMR
jgi:hypothetical protein